MKPLEKGDVVRVKLGGKKKWTKAVVLQKHEHPRSYLIQTEDGGQWRRNRRALISSRELPPQELPEIYIETTNEPVVNNSDENQKASKLYKTRSGRIIKKTDRYVDN